MKSEGPLDPGGKKSIVVLPFENLSGDPEQEFFVAGMHDALITELAQIHALRVISRTSAMAYKDRRVPVPEIARELGVGGILEASVMKVDDRTRIQAQLIQAFPVEDHLWAQTYDRDMTDVLTMHSELAKAVAQQIEVELSPRDETRLLKTRQVTPENYELYLRGRFHIYKFTPEGIETGLRYLNQAVENEPDEPLPYATLALAWAVIGHTPSPPPDAMTRARDTAEKALELDDSLAEAHLALAEVKVYHEWDLEGAGRTFNRALELNPNLAEARGHYSWYLALSGTMQDSIVEMRRARTMDPLNPLFSAWLAWQHCWAGQFEEALEEATKSLELNPDFPIGHYAMGFAYTGLGRFEEAIPAHEKAGALSPMFAWGLGCTYAAMGEEEKALGVARRLEENLTDWNAWCLAEIYATLGDADTTIKWLTEALERRHSYIPWLNRVPLFDFLHPDPRYHELVQRGNSPA